MTTVLISPGSPQMTAQLESVGLRVVTWPFVDLAEVKDHSLLDEAIENLFGYDWLLLKSAPAAEFFLRRFHIFHEVAQLDDLRVLTIGEDAADKLIASQVHIDVPLPRFASIDVVPAIRSFVSQEALAGLNFLVPSANLTCELFEQQLEAAGARLDRATAYQTTADSITLTRMKALLAGGGIDWVAFQQPEEIEQFAQLFDTDQLMQILAGVGVACGDPETCRTAKQFALDNVFSFSGAVTLANHLSTFPSPR